MNRIKLLAISTIAAVMILGSTIVFASTPAADTSSDTSADQTSVSAELAPAPVRRGGGGSGKALKK